MKGGGKWGLGTPLSTPSEWSSIKPTRLAFKKSLEPSHDVIQSLKKNFCSVLILHLLKPLFSVFQMFQALGIVLF